MKPTGICIVGAGRMGTLRAHSASADPRCQLVHVVDTSASRAELLAKNLGCKWSVDWETAICQREVDVVVVSTSHRFLAPITAAAAKLGKHVFCEKPFAYEVSEAQAIVHSIEEARKEGYAPKVLVGFTLRHHTGIAKAKQMLQEGVIGQPYYIRAHYGHGGRPGYDREWRVNKALGGGGELMDQGVHLIDLSRWFLGDFTSVTGGIGTYFWTGNSDSDAPVRDSFTTSADSVEDNAFMLLRTSIGQTALLHASWTQWKNSFEFEVFGREGALTVSGLGGSYGTETLTHVRRRPEGGRPEINEIPIHDASNVWDREWNAFMQFLLPYPATPGRYSEPASAADGLEVLKIVDRLYEFASGVALPDAEISYRR